MIPIYIISLATETARRQHIMAQIAAHQLNATLIDAVDMRQASYDEIQSLTHIPYHKKAKKQRRLSAGELGCALSHHQIYQRIIQQSSDYTLILEDDAQIIRPLQSLLQAEHLQHIGEQYDFDVLIIGYVKTLPQQLPYYYRRIPLKKRAILHHDNQTIELGTPWQQYGCGTVAYIITRRGAEKLLAFTQKPCVPADDWLSFEKMCLLKVLHSRPAFVLEDLAHFDSTIRLEPAHFLQTKRSSIIIRSVKGCLKHILMNYFGMK